MGVTNDFVGLNVVNYSESKPNHGDGDALSMAEKMCCPLCGNFNRCGMLVEKAASNCWCNTVVINQDVLAKVPENLRNLVCLCANCATS